MMTSTLRSDSNYGYSSSSAHRPRVYSMRSPLARSPSTSPRSTSSVMTGDNSTEICQHLEALLGNRQWSPATPAVDLAAARAEGMEPRDTRTVDSRSSEAVSALSGVRSRRGSAAIPRVAINPPSSPVTPPPRSPSADLASNLKVVTAELADAIEAIDSMAAYILKLEAALKEVPTLHPSEAYTMQEREQVTKQNNWMTRHADVLRRAVGIPDRSADVMKQRAVGQARLRTSQVRIMNERARLGDHTATHIDADTALRLLAEDLSKL